MEANRMNLKQSLDLVNLLKEHGLFNFESTPILFNQYKDDSEFDLKNGHLARQENLLNFMQKVRIPVMLLVGEAPGYRGCRFSGIPFTCETQLLKKGFHVRGSQSSSGPPRDENSAMVFWRVLERFNMSFFIWNSIPIHPHERENLMSNRSPTDAEMKQWRPLLVAIKELLDPTKVIAIGRRAQETLDLAGIENHYVRHPARGGEDLFKEGLRKIACSIPDFIES